MKSKKRSRKTSRGKKSLDRVNVIIIILVLILVLFFLYNILIKEGDFLGELATVGPVGGDGRDLYAEATMRPGVTLPSEVEGCILELESPPFFRNPSAGRGILKDEHALVRQKVPEVLGLSWDALGFDGEFFDAFNGMTFTEVSMEDCALLKSRISVVKEIHPNIQFTVLLDESVKSIKGHLAYSEFGLSGEGQVIAVIDTGIDPDHESVNDMDDVNSGAVVGEVNKSETTSVTFQDTSYAVSIVFIDNDQVSLRVNNEEVPGMLMEEDTAILSDGKIITVRDIINSATRGLAVIFSIGISSDTEDNDPKIIGWKDFVNFRPEPYDDHGHGTHCAGIAAGTGGVPLGNEILLTSSNPTKTVNVGGSYYSVELVSASDTSATIKVDEDAKEISEGQSKVVGGVQVYVKSADESNTQFSAILKLTPVATSDDLENGETVYRGVAPGAKLVGVKVLNRRGGGTFSQVIAGIEWTIQNKDKYGITVISMSLGARVNGDGTTPIEVAATTAAENGISFVVAAGNSGPRANSVGIPASAKKVIAVGAVDNNHDIARFSSRGPTKDDRIKPEVSAPGVSVMAPTANTYDSYHRWSGTSMAAPHVAGVVALLKEADPELNTEEISELLKKTALDRGEKGEDNTYGWGVVDVLQALLEISPQEHELLIREIDVKDHYDTKTAINFDTVIENKGLSNEENVNVKLYVNNVEISNRYIDEFKSGSTKLVKFIYFPKKDGIYEMKVVVDTVPGETIVFDNEYSREVVVKDYKEIISAVVLDSWGSEYNVYTIFDYLMENWNDFGEYSLDIDYTSFNNKEITYDDLKANGAEVLIISNAWSDGTHISGVNWEFSDDEIAAIKKYVGEGHGLIVTAGTLSVEPGGVENNMKLSPLLGVDETSDTYWSDYSDQDFNINYKKHHLFDNMDGYYGVYYTLSDLKLLDGDLLAESVDKTSMITGHHYLEGNTIHFTGAPEYYRSYHDDRQAFYNALVWTTNKFENNGINLKLEDLEIDGLIKKGDQTNFKAQIVNEGGESQNGIIVKLLIDDDKINPLFLIENLASGESKEVTFSYIFEEVGSHNVEMVVDPLDNENKEYDNYLSKNVKVPRAFMTGNFVESTTDPDEDGLYDSLLIDVEFEIFEEGHYNMRGLLTSQLGVELLQDYEGAFLEEGVNNLQLSFRGLDLRRWGLNGPYTLKNLRLYSEDGRTNYDVEYQTEAYLADDFESYPDPSINYVRRNPWNPFVNDSVDIEISLENIGTESSSEITVELYEREENSDILIGSTTTGAGLGVFERSYVHFAVTPDKEGWIEYLVRITSEGDGNLENNLYYFDIRVISDIPQLYSYWSGPYEVPIGQEFDIRANVYYDYGRPDVVRGVVVDLYKEKDIKFTPNGDDKWDITFTDYRGHEKTFQFAKNVSGGSLMLTGDDSGRNISVFEGEKIHDEEYMVVGNEDEGRLIKLTNVKNASSGTSSDRVTFQDVFSGDRYETSWTSDGVGTIDIGGKSYGVTLEGQHTLSTDILNVSLDYPDSSGTGVAIAYPTIETSKGAKLAFYEPIYIANMLTWSYANALTELKFPDGDGYTSVASIAQVGPAENWSFGPGGATGVINTSLSTGSSSFTFSIGQLTYNASNWIYDDSLRIALVDDVAGTGNILQAAVVIFQEKDDNNNYEALIVDEFDGFGTKELIGSEEIGDLRKNEWRKVAQFSYTPENLGELELIGMLRADDQINEDNSFTRYIQVIPNEADVLGDFTFKESYGIINTANLIYINVRNQGNSPAINVNVKLYDNGVEISDASISTLESGESVPLLSEWTPTTVGEHELELVVTADEDADLTNNAYKETINVLDKKTLNFNIMNLLRESIPRYLTLDEDRYFVNVIPFITEIVDIEESDIGINNIYADDTSYKDAFTVLLGSELTENMDVTTEYYEDIEDKGLEFSFIYANNPEWSYDGLSYNLLYYDEEVGVEDMSVYECSDWNFVDKICNINWVLNEEELKVINRDGNFIMGESTKNDIQALGLTLKEGVLIDDEPLERDDQDTTPASSSDISSDDTSSRRSRVGFRTTSFASTKGKKVSQSAFFSNKRAGETMKMKIGNRMLPIDYIEITFKNDQRRGYLRFNQVDSPKGIPSKGNNVYAYFNIDHSNIDNNNVESGKIEFKVEKIWFNQKNVEKENVVLSRYKEGFGWEELSTSPLKSGNEYDHYTSDITGMSIFAISAKELEVVEIPTQVVDKKESKKIETETDVTDNKMWMIIGAVIIGILILVMIIIIVVVKSRKKRRLTTIKGMELQGTNN